MANTKVLLDSLIRNRVINNTMAQHIEISLASTEKTLGDILLNFRT